MAQDHNRTLKIRAKDDVAAGVYANFMSASHTREEFVLDFINLVPPEGHLTSRIILNPRHMKRIVQALTENLRRYEERYGPIEASEETPSSVIIDPTPH